MLYREIIAVCSEIHTKHTNTLCGQNVEFVEDKVIRWRERTNKIQLIRYLLSNFLSQHVSGIIMPIIRRIRPCPTACGVLPGCVGCGWLWSCGAESWAVCTVWKLLFDSSNLLFLKLVVHKITTPPYRINMRLQKLKNNYLYCTNWKRL